MTSHIEGLDEYRTIKELEPQAAVITDGFTVNERDVPDVADDVTSWLDEVGC